jgi:cytidylate kinase
MTAITISREFGSGAELLAKRVAHELGYHLVEKEFISAVLVQYGLAEFDVEYEKQPGFWEGFSLKKSEQRDTMVRMLNRVIQTLARHGNVVIHGRSGFASLAGLADVLHVRLHAPLAHRIEIIRKERGISLDEASALVAEQDKVRKAFVESFYGVPWDSPHAFDMVINAATIPADLITSWVITAAKSRREKTGDGPTTKQIEIDPVLMQAVTERLGCSKEHP